MVDSVICTQICLLVGRISFSSCWECLQTALWSYLSTLEVILAEEIGFTQGHVLFWMAYFQWLINAVYKDLNPSLQWRTICRFIQDIEPPTGLAKFLTGVDHSFCFPLFLLKVPKNTPWLSFILISVSVCSLWKYFCNDWLLPLMLYMLLVARQLHNRFFYFLFFRIDLCWRKLSFYFLKFGNI